jgi:hypothetical protein
MTRTMRICAAAAAAVALVGLGSAEAQKKPGGGGGGGSTTCAPSPLPDGVERVLTLTGKTGEGFGQRPRAAIVTYPSGDRLIVAAPNRNEKVYLYALDPANPDSATLLQTVDMPSLDSRRTFFPQYTSLSADFDGNGVTDFAFSNSNPGMVYVLMGAFNDQGELRYERHLISTPAGGSSLSFGSGIGAGDLDRDGHDELVARDDTQFFIYSHTTIGAFELKAQVAPTRGAGDSFGGFGFAVADVTGNGYADIVAGSRGTTVNGVRGAGSVLVLKNHGNLVFSEEPRLVAASPTGESWGHRVLAASLGDDPVVDLGVSSQAGKRVDVRDGGAPIPSTNSRVLSSHAPLGDWAYWGLEAADLNGDARLDVVATGNDVKSQRCEFTSVVIWLSSPDGSYPASVLVQPGGTGAALIPRQHATDNRGLLILGDSRWNNGDGRLYVYRVN